MRTRAIRTTMSCHRRHDPYLRTPSRTSFDPYHLGLDYTMVCFVPFRPQSVRSTFRTIWVPVEPDLAWTFRISLPFAPDFESVIKNV